MARAKKNNVKVNDENQMSLNENAIGTEPVKKLKVVVKKVKNPELSGSKKAEIGSVIDPSKYHPAGTVENEQPDGSVVEGILLERSDKVQTPEDVLADVKAYVAEQSSDGFDPYADLDKSVEEIDAEEGSFINDDGRYIIRGDVRVVRPVGSKSIQILTQHMSTDRECLKHLCKLFLTAQKTRIAAQNRLTAAKRNYEERGIHDPEGLIAMELHVCDQKMAEENTLNILASLISKTKIGQWLNAINGIGPSMSARLIAHFDPERGKHPSSFIHYCGYNDQNTPRYDDSQVREIVNYVCGKSTDITDDMIMKISSMTGRSYRFLDRFSRVVDEETGEVGPRTRKKLESSLKLLTYNRDAKTLMFLITDQFVRRSGPKAPIDPRTGKPKSLYGNYFREKWAELKLKNEQGGFAAYAAELLQRYNYTEKKTLEKLRSGRLSDKHIMMMARRKAGSLFLHHLHTAMMLDMYPGRQVEAPWILTYGGHTDYIAPEVPFEDYFTINPNGIYIPREQSVRMDQDRGFKLNDPSKIWKGYEDISAF